MTQPSDVRLLTESRIGSPNGVAGLDGSGRLPSNQLSDITDIAVPTHGELIDVLAASPSADPTYVLGGTAQDSGPAFAAAFNSAQASIADDPLGITINPRRGRKRIYFPTGTYYTSQGVCMMSTSSGHRTFGLSYSGSGKSMTQIVFDPGNGNPRTGSDGQTGVGGNLYIFSSASANFSNADLGRRILIYTAGSGGGTHDTIITVVENATTVQLGTPAISTVSGCNFEIAADCALLYDGDKWADVTFKDLEFIARQPTTRPPDKVVQSGRLGRTVADGAINNGSVILTSSTANFTYDDIGQVINIAGAGASGGALSTTIASINSSASANLSAAASTTVSGASVSIQANMLRLDRTVSDAAITSGSTTLSSSSANFTSADLGVTVGVAGAGPTASLLRASIQKVISATQVQLNGAASATVSGAQCTIAGPQLTGRHIGNQITVAGAGAGGTPLIATVLALLQENSSTGTETIKVKLSVPSSTIVTNAQTTIQSTASAIFMRCTSNGGVVMQEFDNCVWRGAWADVILLDGSNQGADFSFTDCEVYDRPGTFLRLLPDPGFLQNSSSDQQLDYNFRGGLWAPTYGDFINFDGRGGHITCEGGTMTIGGFPLTADAGGTLPVPCTGSISTDPGGTWFKLRDRDIVHNRRVLYGERLRFEERNSNCFMRDIEWSVGMVTFVNCADDSVHATLPTDRFSRIACLSAPGPTVRDLNCTWKGAHEYRHSNLTWRYPHSITYTGCHLVDALAAALFLTFTATDGTNNVASQKPMITFDGNTKVSTAYTSSNSYMDHGDTEVNWATAPHGVTRKKRVRLAYGANSGVPAPSAGASWTGKLPYGAHVTAFRFYRVAAGSSTDTTWQLVIKDAGGTTVATFAPGVGGVPSGQQWQSAGDWTQTLTSAWVCASTNNRQLTATLTGAAGTADGSGILEIEYIG